MVDKPGNIWYNKKWKIQKEAPPQGRRSKSNKRDLYPLNLREVGKLLKDRENAIFVHYEKVLCNHIIIAHLIDLVKPFSCSRAGRLVLFSNSNCTLTTS